VLHFARSIGARERLQADGRDAQHQVVLPRRQLLCDRVGGSDIVLGIVAADQRRLLIDESVLAQRVQDPAHSLVDNSLRCVLYDGYPLQVSPRRAALFPIGDQQYRLCRDDQKQAKREAPHTMSGFVCVPLS